MPKAAFDERLKFSKSWSQVDIPDRPNRSIHVLWLRVNYPEIGGWRWCLVSLAQAKVSGRPMHVDRRASPRESSQAAGDRLSPLGVVGKEGSGVFALAAWCEVVDGR